MFQNKSRCDVTTEMRRIFICADSADTDLLESFVEDVISLDAGANCLVTWVSPHTDIDIKELHNTLFNTSVMIVLVTPNLYSYIVHNGLPQPIRIMQELERPYFPVVTNFELFELYCAKDRKIHGLCLDDNEYRKNLKEQLKKFVLSDDLVKEIREKAFDGQFFMSYRKTDAEAAQELMVNIHNIPELEAISIWFDRFLTAGVEFNDEIYDAIRSSQVFMMAITPNTISKRDDGEDNFVVKFEYPYAKKMGCTIVPVIASKGVYGELNEYFENIDIPLTLDAAHDILKKAIYKVPVSDIKDSERLYYLGRAYETGYFVEQDIRRCIKLLKSVACGCDTFALDASAHLADMYHSGDLVDGISYEDELCWRKRVTEICDEKFGNKHPNTANAYNNLAFVCQAQGDYDKALVFYNKALAIREKVLGKEHPETSITYNNLAIVYQDQSDYEKALAFFYKALAIREKVLGKEHPDTATTYNNIAVVYHAQGDYDKALAFFYKALAIREKVLGKEHPDTATTYNNLAGIYQDQGDYDKALAFYYKSYTIFKKYREVHPTLKVIISNMKSAYENAGLTRSFGSWLETKQNEEQLSELSVKFTK